MQVPDKIILTNSAISPAAPPSEMDNLIAGLEQEIRRGNKFLIAEAPFKRVAARDVREASEEACASFRKDSATLLEWGIRKLRLAAKQGAPQVDVVEVLVRQGLSTLGARYFSKTPAAQEWSSKGPIGGVNQNRVGSRSKDECEEGIWEDELTEMAENDRQKSNRVIGDTVTRSKAEGVAKQADAERKTQGRCHFQR